MEIVLLIIAFPFLFLIFGLIREKVDPAYKKRTDCAKRVWKQLAQAGINEKLIKDAIRKQCM